MQKKGIKDKNICHYLVDESFYCTDVDKELYSTEDVDKELLEENILEELERADGERDREKLTRNLKIITITICVIVIFSLFIGDKFGLLHIK